LRGRRSASWTRQSIQKWIARLSSTRMITETLVIYLGMPGKNLFNNQRFRFQDVAFVSSHSAMGWTPSVIQIAEIKSKKQLIFPITIGDIRSQASLSGAVWGRGGWSFLKHRPSSLPPSILLFQPLFPVCFNPSDPALKCPPDPHPPHQRVHNDTYKIPEETLNGANDFTSQPLVIDFWIATFSKEKRKILLFGWRWVTSIQHQIS
jgi:hypothetical protein